MNAQPHASLSGEAAPSIGPGEELHGSAVAAVYALRAIAEAGLNAAHDKPPTGLFLAVEFIADAIQAAANDYERAS